MVYLILLFLEIAALFFLSKKVSRDLSGFMSINLMSFVFLPGVIVHELSHLFIAAILFVPVGNMEFTPRKSGNGVKLGSVEVAKTDPVRRSIIGFAPVFTGLMLVVGMVYLFSSNILFFQDKGLYVFVGTILVLIYLLFAVSNTMFSSPKDMEGTAEILIVLLIILGATYALGLRVPPSLFSRIFTEELVGVVQKSAIFLLAPIVIDTAILGIISVFKSSRSRIW